MLQILCSLLLGLSFTNFRMSKIPKPVSGRWDNPSWQSLTRRMNSTHVQTIEKAFWWKHWKSWSSMYSHSRRNTKCALRTPVCRTLRSILRFIEGYIQKGRFFRILTFVPKRRKFKRFRRMLADIVGRLNVCFASCSASCFHYTCRSLYHSSYPFQTGMK